MGEVVERSIAGQIELWAKLGRALEPLLRGDQVLALARAGEGHIRGAADSPVASRNSDWRRRRGHPDKSIWFQHPMGRRADGGGGSLRGSRPSRLARGANRSPPDRRGLFQ